MPNIFKNKNYYIKKNIINKKLILNFNNELEKYINNLIKKNKLLINKKLSINVKLLALEEINHKYIAHIYGAIKQFKSFKKIYNNKKLLLISKKYLEKNIKLFTKAVRLDLSNNTKWNLEWHQENSYVNSKNKFLFFWFPLLNDNDSITGGLNIYDKPTPKAYKIRKIHNKNSQAQKIPEFDIKKKYVSEVRLKLGDVLIFDRYLLHKSVTNFSYKSKISCVLSYYKA